MTDFDQKAKENFADHQKILQTIFFIEPMTERLFMIVKPTISFIIFWDFSMFYQICLSPQVKQCVIITYKLLLMEYTSCLTSYRRT